MRTNIVIDDQLMREALRARPGATKKAVVEEGLRLLSLLGRQAKIRELRGALKSEGDLAAMRPDAH